MRKQKDQRKRISNRRARHDYSLDDSLVVGIALNGRETKALRLGQASLQGAYVTIKDSAKGGELWLINASIMGGKGIAIDDTEKIRSRKLLAKRREIDELISLKHEGKTIVPLEILTGGRYIKLRISAGTGKKKYDKRAALKKRDDTRRVTAELKRRG